MSDLVREATHTLVPDGHRWLRVLAPLMAPLMAPMISCPLRFVTGHSHVRAFRVLDNHSVAYEAGNYLNTVGFASFSYPPSASNASSSASSNFEYRNIDANQVSMASVAGLNSTTPLLTAAGAALQAEIVRVAATLGLNDVLGCAPRTYGTYLPLSSAESLWRLWMQVGSSDCL